MFALISLDVLDIKPETWLIYHDLTEGCQFSNYEWTVTYLDASPTYHILN